jgi:hypothetical protein
LSFLDLYQLERIAGLAILFGVFVALLRVALRLWLRHWLKGRFWL